MSRRCTRRRFFHQVALGSLAWAWAGELMADPPPGWPGGGYDRPGRWPKQSRSVTVAQQGMVATSHPLAVLVGLDVLRRGGNAVDAAVAVNATLGVVEPMSCGIGGDLFALVWDSKTGRLYGLNASGRAPQRATLEEYRRRGLKFVPTEGPLSWTVPGCVAGWEDLLRRFGTMPLRELLAEAIRYAEQGAPVPEVIASYWRAAQPALARHEHAAQTFLPGGKAPKAGDLFRNPDLGRTYRLIARDGAAAFYHGPIAQQIVQFSEKHGGLFTLEDFAQHRNQWVEPVSTTYRGYQVWELPPNGQGIAVLQMLNVLEGFDLARLGFGSVEYVHLLVEAKKLAFADRARFYADPEMAQVPVNQLISKSYAQKRRQLISLDRVLVDVGPGTIPPAGETVYLSVVDQHRNCCSLIQSIYYGFGSKMVPQGLGFALQNRGALFALDPEHPNCLAPGKRPFHTIIPAMVTQQNRPVFCFGVMGGDMQPQGQVQVLINLIDFGMNVQQAGDAPRVRHVGSPSPTGAPGQGAGTVLLESGFSEQTLQGLRRLGHRVQRSQGGFGGYQGIWIDWQRGVLLGASEARKDGCALGY